MQSTHNAPTQEVGNVRIEWIVLAACCAWDSGTRCVANRHSLLLNMFNSKIATALAWIVCLGARTFDSTFCVIDWTFLNPAPSAWPMVSNTKAEGQTNDVTSDEPAKHAHVTDVTDVMYISRDRCDVIFRPDTEHLLNVVMFYPARMQTLFDSIGYSRCFHGSFLQIIVGKRIHCYTCIGPCLITYIRVSDHAIRWKGCSNTIDFCCYCCRLRLVLRWSIIVSNVQHKWTNHGVWIS